MWLGAIHVLCSAGSRCGSDDVGDQMSDDQPVQPKEDRQSLAGAIEALAKALQRQPQVSEASTWKSVKSIIETLLPSLVMFGLGYAFVQGVELDLKREEFTASAADKLKTYVDTLMTANFGDEPQKLRSTALALGGFGGVAALPLLSIVDAGGEAQIAAGKLGLEQAGRVAPDATCSVVAAAIADPTGAYKWTTRKELAEVAGLVGCSEARNALERLRPAIESMDILTPEQRTNFAKTVDDSLKHIDAARQGKWPWQ